MIDSILKIKALLQDLHLLVGEDTWAEFCEQQAELIAEVELLHKLYREQCLDELVSISQEMGLYDDFQKINIPQDPLWNVVKTLPSDYTDYGGTVERWATEEDYPDCCSCKYFRRLIGEYEDVEDADWGVCTNPLSPRAGLLTFEHQAGKDCCVRDEK